MSDDGDSGIFDDFEAAESNGGGGGAPQLAAGAGWAIHGLVTDNR